MRSGRSVAWLLARTCLLLLGLLGSSSLTQAARQGQDIKCGGGWWIVMLNTHYRDLPWLFWFTFDLLLCLLFVACRALVDEMEWAISQVDPKKTTQTGSFRINPDGSQSIREVGLHS